jgi:hypothetical protein
MVEKFSSMRTKDRFDLEFQKVGKPSDAQKGLV